MSFGNMLQDVSLFCRAVCPPVNVFVLCEQSTPHLRRVTVGSSNRYKSVKAVRLSAIAYPDPVEGDMGRWPLGEETAFFVVGRKEGLSSADRKSIGDYLDAEFASDEEARKEIRERAERYLQATSNSSEGFKLRVRKLLPGRSLLRSAIQKKSPRTR